MPRHEFLQSSAFRLAGVFIGLLSAALLVVGWLFYSTLSSELLEHLDERIDDQVALFETELKSDGEASLSALIRRHMQTVDTEDRLYYFGRAGTRIAGVDLPEAVPGSRGYFTRADPKGDVSLYRYNGRKLAEHDLIVAFEAEHVEEMNSILRRILAWFVPLVLGLALVLALVFARRSQTRLAGFRQSLSSVADGELSQRLAVSGSNDDVDRFAREINSTLARLQTTVEAIRQVSTDIAHDLKTPIGRLSIAIENALDKLEAGDDAAPDLQLAQIEADTVNRTFDALLRISQIEAADRTSEFARLDLSGIVENLVDGYEAAADEHGALLSVQLRHDDAHPVNGDSSLMTQMLANLLDNALHHGGNPATVAITTSSDAAHVVLEVADHGPGIAPEERDKVFRRLYRLERSRTTPGNGLGLSLVKAVTELHGGTITLSDNEPGLKVSIRLPVSKNAAKVN
ncbi:MAG: HAMP domain-containing sensor histidine kinase [Pseudomonadota bacterium]